MGRGSEASRRSKRLVRTNTQPRVSGGLQRFSTGRRFPTGSGCAVLPYRPLQGNSVLACQLWTLAAASNLAWRKRHTAFGSIPNRPAAHSCGTGRSGGCAPGSAQGNKGTSLFSQTQSRGDVAHDASLLDWRNVWLLVVGVSAGQVEGCAMAEGASVRQSAVQRGDSVLVWCGEVGWLANGRLAAVSNAAPGWHPVRGQGFAITPRPVVGVAARALRRAGCARLAAMEDLNAGGLECEGGGSSQHINRRLANPAIPPRGVGCTPLSGAV
jgi:hypothetical protein